MGETNSLITQVAHVTAWSRNGLAHNLQDKINSLQDSALNENKFINFIDIKISDLDGYVIYEISK